MVKGSNKSERCCNDNAFVFNRILGFNTEFYDIRTKNWYWDEVNQKIVTFYIKYGNKHCEYIQPICSDNDKQIVTKDNEIIVFRANVIPSAPVLEGIVKHIILLYRYVMKKTPSTMSIHPPTNESKEDDEYQIKANITINLHLL